jgi:hypothetical protein
MTKVHLADWGRELFGRSAGREVREALHERIHDDDELVVDCSGVVAMSLSFADEAFAVLAAELTRSADRPAIRIANASRDVSAVVRLALARSRELA